MCGINAVGAQGSGCMFTFCHDPLKIALLLHKMAKVPYSFSETVYPNFPVYAANLSKRLVTVSYLHGKE